MNCKPVTPNRNRAQAMHPADGHRRRIAIFRYRAQMLLEELLRAGQREMVPQLGRGMLERALNHATKARSPQLQTPRHSDHSSPSQVPSSSVIRLLRNLQSGLLHISEKRLLPSSLQQRGTAVGVQRNWNEQPAPLLNKLITLCQVGPYTAVFQPLPSSP